MRRILKDILTAVFLGMILPGILLNTAVGILGESVPDREIQVTQSEPPPALEIHLRLEDDRVQKVDLKDYLTRVLLAEVPASFEPEALKAQAVASRTYALKAAATGGKHGDGSVCTRSACCQGYLDEEAYLSRGGTQEGIDKIQAAVLATGSQCLMYEDALIEAVYFSCSGGSTEDAQAVWGREFPYLQAVESPGEEGAAHYRDSICFTPEQFCQALGKTLTGAPETWFGTTVYTQGGGVATMKIGEVFYTGVQLRAMLGLRSTAFSVEAGEEIVITTRGYGHRVGMSQYGADAMAVQGNPYDEILLHYYPGTVLMEWNLQA